MWIARQATGGTATANGDPHLQNVLGERFDLMRPGKHVLIQIPRHVEDAFLRVQADARLLGGDCADMYFQDVNVTGSWAEAKKTGGYRYGVSQRDVETPEWIAFGKVEVESRSWTCQRWLAVFERGTRSICAARDMPSEVYWEKTTTRTSSSPRKNAPRRCLSWLGKGTALSWRHLRRRASSDQVYAYAGACLS